jgi:hypothetical protein
MDHRDMRLPEPQALACATKRMVLVYRVAKNRTGLPHGCFIDC